MNYRLLLTLNALLISGFLVSCEQPGTPPPAGPSSNTTAQNSVPQTPAAPAPAAETENLNMPVTMPLLDALFADEAFVQQAKQELQLTDEEVQKIRDAARNSVLELNENGSGDDSARSTQSATSSTEKEIKAVIGDDKTKRLFALARKHWAGDGSALLADAKPNAVPTDTRIVVNSPAYRMDVFKDGKLVKTYKVGIGYPEFPLPTGLRQAKEIIFNPTWTPPDEPWVKGKVQPGRKVEAGSKLNPLGPIKIPIGLPSLIHGGKSPSRLGTFASHGCVGLTSPQVQDFAQQLSSISGTPLTAEEVKVYQKNKTDTKELKLAQPIPVELRYETIVVENGKLKIFRDVYERGTNTEENLRKVLESYSVSLDDLDPQLRASILEGLEQMAYDAKGRPVDDDAAANANSAKKNQSSTVTRSIKGKKEVVFDVPALSGKGYPEPVSLSAA